MLYVNCFKAEKCMNNKHTCDFFNQNFVFSRNDTFFQLSLLINYEEFLYNTPLIRKSNYHSGKILCFSLDFCL